MKRGAKEKSRKRASVDKPGVFEIRSVVPKEEPATPNRKPLIPCIGMAKS